MVCQSGYETEYELEYGVDYYNFYHDDKWMFYRENTNIPRVPDPFGLQMYSFSGVLKVCKEFGANLYHLYMQDALNARMLCDMGFQFDLYEMLAHVAGISANELVQVIRTIKAVNTIEENRNVKSANSALTPVNTVV